MSDFFSTRSATAPPQDMVARKEAMMNAVRQEIAIQNVQELMNKANERCYSKCIARPGESLSSAEQTCLSRCFGRYLDAFTIVSRTYSARLSRERHASIGSLQQDSL